jgi:hypothetical protein
MNLHEPRCGCPPPSEWTAPLEIRDIPHLARIPYWLPSGVYFLCRFGKVIYVGQSVNVLGRIGAHDNNGVKFDSAFWFPVPRRDLLGYEAAWIKKLQPKENTVGKRRPPPWWPAWQQNAWVGKLCPGDDDGEK